jgi:hypothetical protein
MRQSLCHPNEPVLTRFPNRHDVVTDGPVSTLLQKRKSGRVFPRGEFTREPLISFRSAAAEIGVGCEQSPHGIRFLAFCVFLFVPLGNIKMKQRRIY